MQCHLGLHRSRCCDFALESFTRGLAGKNADKQAQRFVAVIVRHPATSCASRSSIALLSRPDHNAVAPCAKSISLYLLRTSRRSSEAIT
jgi:hypothetical protein